MTLFLMYIGLTSTAANDLILFVYIWIYSQQEPIIELFIMQTDDAAIEENSYAPSL